MSETRSTYEELCRVMCTMARELEKAEAKVLEIWKVRMNDSARNEELKAKVKELEAEAGELRCRLDDAERDSGLRRAHTGPETLEAHREAVRDLKGKIIVCRETYSHGPNERTIRCGERSPALGHVWLCTTHYRELDREGYLMEHKEPKTDWPDGYDPALVLDPPEEPKI